MKEIIAISLPPHLIGRRFMAIHRPPDFTTHTAILMCGVVAVAAPEIREIQGGVGQRDHTWGGGERFQDQTTLPIIPALLAAVVAANGSLSPPC